MIIFDVEVLSERLDKREIQYGTENYVLVYYSRPSVILSAILRNSSALSMYLDILTFNLHFISSDLIPEQNC